MEKTTIETMKSVIQDWLGQCKTPEELGRTYAEIRADLELTFTRDMQVKTGVSIPSIQVPGTTTIRDWETTATPLNKLSETNVYAPYSINAGGKT